MGQAYNCFTSELVHNECDAFMVVSGCAVEHGVKHICISSRMPECATHLMSFWQQLVYYLLGMLM